MKATIEKRATNWLLGNYGGVGVSSKTIWAVMMDCMPDDPEPFQFSTPRDPSDFHRCVKLLKLIPEWKEGLHKVAAIFPKWNLLVKNWERFEKLLEEELERSDGSAPMLYAEMKKIDL